MRTVRTATMQVILAAAFLLLASASALRSPSVFAPPKNITVHYPCSLNETLVVSPNEEIIFTCVGIPATPMEVLMATLQKHVLWVNSPHMTASAVVVPELGPRISRAAVFLLRVHLWHCQLKPVWILALFRLHHDWDQPNIVQYRGH